MTTAPFVELGFNPTDLRPRDMPHAGAFLGSPADALEAALAVARAAMADRVRNEIKGIAEPSQAQLLRIADLAWQAAFWNFRKVSAPIIADAYIRAYRRANAGDVPMSVIYDLADKHAEKVGDYFHSSSRNALAEGFSLQVNRRIPARVAANKVLDGYGLTPRQMRSFIGASQFETSVSSTTPRSLKSKARAYIERAFTTRIRKMSRQEEHNIDQQAQQFAWMWLQDKGRLPEKAQKMWITARDERVCPVCGPLHGKKVLVGNQFKTAHGDFWTPGLHPNCRCVVRLLENRFAKNLAGADLKEFNQLHPRADDGRFGVKTRTKTLDVDTEFARLTAPKRHTAVERSTDVELEQMFQDVVTGAIKPQATVTPVVTAGKVSVSGGEPKVRPVVQTARPQVTTRGPQVKTAGPAVATTAPMVTAKPITKPKIRPKVDTSTVTVRQGTKASQPKKTGWFTEVNVYDEHPEDERLVVMSKDKKLSRDEEALTKEVSDKYKRDMETLPDQIHAEYNNTFSNNTGDQLQLDDQQVKEVVEWYGRRQGIGYERGTEPVEQLADRTQFLATVLDVEGRPARDEKGDIIREAVSPNWVAEQFDLPRSMHRSRVIEIPPEHVKMMRSAGVGGPNEASGSVRPIAEGIFRLEPGSYRRVTGHDVTVEVVRAKPLNPPKKKK